jgi:hypothetical protein
LLLKSFKKPKKSSAVMLALSLLHAPLPRLARAAARDLLSDMMLLPVLRLVLPMLVSISMIVHIHEVLALTKKNKTKRNSRNSGYPGDREALPS